VRPGAPVGRNPGRPSHRVGDQHRASDVPHRNELSGEDPAEERQRGIDGGAYREQGREREVLARYRTDDGEEAETERQESELSERGDDAPEADDPAEQREGDEPGKQAEQDGRPFGRSGHVGVWTRHRVKRSGERPMPRPAHRPDMLLQVPGAPELLVILLVLGLLVGIPVVLAGVFLFTRVLDGDSDDADVARLKARVDELEAELAAGSEAAHNDVTVEENEAGKRRERSERRETASEASGEERPASSADEDDADR